MKIDIKKFEPFWDAWYIKDIIGEGSFGKVYSIERNDFGNTYMAALKHLRVPQSQSEVKSIMADGMNKESAERYFEKFVENIVEEFVLMSKLKGNSHIVSYEDHKVVKNPNKIEWDIFIRMEKLTGLIDYISQNKISKKDVIKLGIDICKALELCQKYNIIHRDIKPENIFVSDNGDFKLGDFGIARQIEKTTAGLSKKGTYTYIAPEVYKGEPYGSTVDIYSLGIVMYRLLNNNRTPFMPEYPKIISHEDREIALVERMRGTKLPKPINADGRLAEIVLKACEFKSEKRYSSPLSMRMELQSIFYTDIEGKIIYPKGDIAEIKSIKYVNSNDNKESTMFMPVSNNGIDETKFMRSDNIDKDKASVFKLKNKKAVYAVAGMIGIIIISLGVYGIFQNTTNEKINLVYDEISEAETNTIQISETENISESTEELKSTTTVTETMTIQETITEKLTVATDDNEEKEVSSGYNNQQSNSNKSEPKNISSNKNSEKKSSEKVSVPAKETPAPAKKMPAPAEETPAPTIDKSLEEKIKADRAAIEKSLNKSGTLYGNTPN